ncbi:MAG: nucleotidyltransferase domain-containing protein [Bacteroidota bacterium]
MNILQKIKEVVCEIDPQAEVILFGSRKRNEAKDDSDRDILILVPYPVNLRIEQKFRHRLFDIELEHGQAISTFVYSKSDWHTHHKVTPLYQNIEQEGGFMNLPIDEENT